MLGVSTLSNIDLPLRIALFLMFMVTASAHWGKGRADLIRMVPPAFPNPAVLVSVTGVLEILGAIGLVIPGTARVAAVCLAILLLALFPANVRAAREHLMIMGRPVPGLFVRGVIQLIFLAALITVAAHLRR
ncbi:MAG TPA: DoxX family membrane protein [Terracidiphilus sp.]|nr:DoxX family membrane protein [Terracidiphilus sp.]